jgi:hypothetical protein
MSKLTPLESAVIKKLLDGKDDVPVPDSNSNTDYPEEVTGVSIQPRSSNSVGRAAEFDR